ncbi:MAG: hypothetical protein E7353_01780 [Clostridiales bacterium]|nr:hypothetical protein [Clostridiales bacterium]
MCILGIDIGTTTISAVVLSLANGEALKSVTIKNDTFIKSEIKGERIQDVNKIEEKALCVVNELTEQFPIKTIGVTGQMHGILYYDKKGKAVSPLYTWQDERALIKLPGGKNSVEEIKELTGYTVPSGYGLATHYYNMKNGLVPNTAVGLCTIGDYIVGALIGIIPKMHASNGASLGLFDLKINRFDESALKKIGISPKFLPPITSSARVAGIYNGIPVSIAIGDNQASFIGSVSDVDNGLLINVGTGSQISAVSAYNENLQACELRPLLGDKYLVVGCALCGGRAYALLEKFFASFAKELGVEGEQYSIMAKLASKATSSLKVNTTFSGTRKDSTVKGSIMEIDEDNFTPQALTLGFIHGIVDELYGFTVDMEKKSLLVGSGNGIKKNSILASYASAKFGIEIKTPAQSEEASVGACLFAGVSSGIFFSLSKAGRLISYN